MPAVSDDTEQEEPPIERHEVSRTIPADPATIFSIVSSPSGHVAIDASGMLQSWTGEPATAVGDEFVIHMDREALGDLPMGKYDATVTITAYEQDRFITWEVSGPGFPSIGHYYGYRLEPNGDATIVTSIYDWSAVADDLKQYWPVVPLTALKATLGILERTVRLSTAQT
jgi:Polyketide cyclase / dehydrase and lipid transport